jgi:hypothetical protein
MPRDSSGPLWAARALLGGVILGLAAAVAGATWSIVAKPSSVWTAEQAAEYKAANDARHAASIADAASANAGEGPARESTAMRSARKRFERINEELNAARTAWTWRGRVLTACGLGVTILCGMGYLAVRGGGHVDASP